MINTNLMFSSKSDDWETPQYIFDELDSEFHFTLDPCATVFNHKCKKYYTKHEDGLNQSWKGETVFCNPPYGREIGKWVKNVICMEQLIMVLQLCLFLPEQIQSGFTNTYIINRK